MIAAKWYKRKDIRIVNIDEPICSADEVKIQIKWTGICGTDLHEFEAGPIFIPVEPHPITKKAGSVVLGHEFSGVIVEVGSSVKDWKVGDRVTADACIYCGQCDSCKAGHYNLCDNLGFNGLADDGGFAEFVSVPAYQVKKLADRISYEEGALVEPLAVGLHAIEKGRLKKGETVVVIGAGTIGLAALASARALGAGKIIVVEIAEERKKFATTLGADLVIDPSKEDYVQKIQEFNEGNLADISVECVGMDITVKEAIYSVKKGGRVVITGIFSKLSDGIDMNDIVIGEKELIGVIGYQNDFNPVITLIAEGKINPLPFITKKIKLKDIVKEGFEELINNKDKHIKILVEPK